MASERGIGVKHRVRIYIAPCCKLKNGKQSYHLLRQTGLRPENLVPMTCGMTAKEIKLLSKRYEKSEARHGG